MTPRATPLRILFAMCTALALTACSEANVTSPGGSGQVDAGSTGGGTGGGGTGGGGQTGTCPTGTTVVTPGVGNNTTCAISGVIAQNLTLTSGVIYQLNGRVEVGNDIGADGNRAGGQVVTLTIQPGVRVFGNSGADFLQVNRGSRLIANGTSTLPITFTSRQDILGQATLTSRGQWGGIIINGRAPINSCPGPGGVITCEAQVEGSTAFYGGADANDNSGILRYVVVKHSGFEISPNNELNGITLAGVGAGTTIDFVQVHNSSDDGIEWFGGTVNAKHLVLTGISDDSIDWASGWRGNAQFVLVTQATDEGDRIVEADNLPTDQTKTPLTAPNIANFTFIGAAGRSASILLRVGVGGNFTNGVVTGSPQCLDIDDASTVAANPRFHSVRLDCPTNFTNDTNVDATAVAAVFNAGTNNRLGNASLVNRLLPGPQELGMTVFNSSSLSGFFESAPYIGAFSPTETASNNWAFGWTFGVFAPPVCPAGTTQVGLLNGVNRCELRGTVTGNLVLSAGNIYQISGRVQVGNDVGADGARAGGAAATLTIDAGVTVFGNSGADYIEVNRGSRIFANGTPTQPVRMTALADVNGTARITQRGLWGGIIINGRAPINSCPGPGGLVTCEAQVEGSTGFYGGALPTDSSGRLNYVQVKYSGFEISPNNELNGITLAGVGSGTDIQFVQVHNSSDDGIEWFGGTVNARNIVATGISDDSLDWASGWRGNVQFALVVQATDEGDRIVEADNLPTDQLKTPLTAPNVSNFTFIGQSNRSAAILQRVGVGGRLLNGVVRGSPQCLDIDDASTIASAPTYDSVLFDCAAPFVNDTNVDGAAVAARFNAGTNNSTTVPSTLTNTFINGPTETARPVFNVTTLDPFFAPVTYIGAVRNTSDVWWQGWTCGLGSPTPAC
jgi:trimeric autotransporter adhesin